MASPSPPAPPSRSRGAFRSGLGPARGAGLLALVALFPTALGAAQGRTVEGQVLDLAGQGVAGARVIALPAGFSDTADPLGAAVAQRAQPRLHLEPAAHSGADGRFFLELPPTAAGGEEWILVATRYVNGPPFSLEPLEGWVAGAPLALAPGEARLELPLARIELDLRGVAAGAAAEGRFVVREVLDGAHFENWEWLEHPLAWRTEREPRQVFHARPGTSILCAWIAPDGRYAEAVLDVPPDATLLRVPLELPPSGPSVRLEVRLENDFGTAPVGLNRFSIHAPTSGLALRAFETEAPRHGFDLPTGTYVVRAAAIRERFLFCLVGNETLEPLRRASAQELVHVQPGRPARSTLRLTRGGLLRIELVAPEGHLHPLLADLRAGRRSLQDTHFLLTYGEVAAGSVRAVLPDGLPTPHLRWADLGFEGLSASSRPFAGLTPGLGPATSDDRLRAGPCELRVDVPGYSPVRLRVEIPEDGVAEARVELSPLPGPASSSPRSGG